MSQRYHPGSITFSDKSTGLVRVVPASAVPASGLFAAGVDGVVQPIVEVVSETAGRVRTVREYGPAGEMLRSTTQVGVGP